MTTSEQRKVSSSTPDLPSNYEEATPLPETEGQTSCTSSAEAGCIPLANTVFASSDTQEREITVEPIRIKRSLESLERNKRLQKKGLG